MVLSLSKAQISWSFDVLHGLGMKVMSIGSMPDCTCPTAQALLGCGRRETKGCEEGKEKRVIFPDPDEEMTFKLPNSILFSKYFDTF